MAELKEGRVVYRGCVIKASGRETRADGSVFYGLGGWWEWEAVGRKGYIGMGTGSLEKCREAVDAFNRHWVDDPINERTLWYRGQRLEPSVSVHVWEWVKDYKLVAQLPLSEMLPHIDAELDKERSVDEEDPGDVDEVNCHRCGQPILDKAISEAALTLARDIDSLILSKLENNR